MAKTKRNPTDLTTRNAKAAKKRDADLAARISRIERFLTKLFAGWKRA